MVSTRVIFRVHNELLRKAKKKAKKMCCKSVQDYITYLIQRDLFSKHGKEGRPKQSFDDIKFITTHRPLFSKKGKPFKI